MCTSPKVEISPVTHELIDSRLNLARTTVPRILNSDPTYRASQRTRETVFTLARELGYDFSHLRRIHRRQGERLFTNAEAALRFVTEDGRVFDEGVCTIKNVSLAGALIANIQLGKGVIPLTPFRIHLAAKSGPLAHIPLIGKMVRCSNMKEVEIGIAFSPLDHEVLSLLKQALDVLEAKSPAEGLS